MLVKFNNYIMNKTYVVFEGRQKGIFEDWETCEKQIHKFKGQQYKSYASLEEAENSYDDHLSNKNKKTKYEESIFCNVHCNTSSKEMNYYVTDLKNNNRLHGSPKFIGATSHIGDFLAIVEALKIAKKNNDERTIYSSNSVAIKWVENKKINSKINWNSDNEKLFKIVKSYTDWLKLNNYKNIIIKK